jgi:hypothetical protein
MRVLLLLVLLMVGLGSGLASVSAGAQPCPFHTHEHVAAPLKGRHAPPATIEPAGALRSLTAVAALDDAGLVAPHPASDHDTPDGHACCHVAAAVMPVLGPAVEPRERADGKLGWHRRLASPAAPTHDIYRPPALA